MGLRLIFLITGASILTLTTSPISLTDGIEKLLNPLKKIGVPAHELAMMMTIALRFIPTLLEETDKIMKAQMARGADFETGNLVIEQKQWCLSWFRFSSVPLEELMSWHLLWRQDATEAGKTGPE
jgi:energy-coupling factor transport system permease protein